jgi:hypothetical protein
MMSWNCPHCEKQFNYKKALNAHIDLCELLKKPKHEIKHEEDCIENIPSVSELFRCVQELAYENKRNKEEIQRLNHIIKSRKSYQVFANTLAPSKTFQEWIKGFRASQNVLSRVFEFDLWEGIIKCLEERILQEGVGNIPLRAPMERPGVLYIYTTVMPESTKQLVKKWIVCDSENLYKILDKIITQIQTVFLQWQDDNYERIQSSQDEKDKTNIYYQRVGGGGLDISKEKPRSELRNWLCKKVLETYI